MSANVIVTVPLCLDEGCSSAKILSGRVEFRLCNITQSLLEINNYFTVSCSAFISDTHK